MTNVAAGESRAPGDDRSGGRGRAHEASGTSAPDAAMNRLLAVPDGPATVPEDAAHRIFSFSIFLSALRCLLSYVVFPVLAPLLGLATGVTAVIGIPIAVLALVFDALGIRRFWLARHRWRWPMTAIYLAIMGLVATLLAGDISHLVG